MRDYIELEKLRMEERLIHEVNGILVLALTASKNKNKNKPEQLFVFCFSSNAVVIILRWMQTLLIGNISYQRTSP